MVSIGTALWDRAPYVRMRAMQGLLYCLNSRGLWCILSASKVKCGILYGVLADGHGEVGDTKGRFHLPVLLQEKALGYLATLAYKPNSNYIYLVTVHSVPSDVKWQLCYPGTRQ